MIYLQPSPSVRKLVRRTALFFVAAHLALAQVAIAQISTEEPPATQGPIRLRQASGGDEKLTAPAPQVPAQSTATVQPAAQSVLPSEFERFVQSQADGVEIRRLGADVLAASMDARMAEGSPVVPMDYVIGVGDEILLTIWGSVDSDLRLKVDRTGRISIPRVGPVQVSGVRLADLEATIFRRVSQVFRNFQLTATLGQLRGIRVLVSGFVVKPGAYTVNSLSTIIDALVRAGGPSSAGSFRAIELRRRNVLISQFDLYDLLLSGVKPTDVVLQAGDVVFVGPVGVQVGFIGSVNRPTVMELKPGETISDALVMAGGFSAVADRSRVALERLKDRGSARVVQVELPEQAALTLDNGDVLRAFSAINIAFPTARRNKRVRVEGEVNRPAEYVLPEGSSIADALRAAGGLTAHAFIFATEFYRESVRSGQQQSYERALRDLETDLARSSASRRVATTEEVTSDAARVAASARLLDRLRALQPSGRIVLNMTAESNDLPDLALEDGDRLYIPAKSTTVGVFGSVFNAASYLHLPGKNLDDYLRLAGGPTRGADEGSIFVIRANGNVVSARQSAGWFARRGDLAQLKAEPGDTVFVPEELDKTTFVQGAKDWTQILYQFGIGLAGIKSAIR